MINMEINAQPDDETCGATCLHTIYQHYGYDISHEEVIKTVKRSASGGTLAPYLGVHALERGFTAMLIYLDNFFCNFLERWTPAMIGF
jgi:ABC-type bacteriocin/lantibiotic exporter with double-glycine peptidase domain